jgi:hypothetical protein
MLYGREKSAETALREPSISSDNISICDLPCASLPLPNPRPPRPPIDGAEPLGGWAK